MTYGQSQCESCGANTAQSMPIMTKSEIRVEFMPGIVAAAAPMRIRRALIGSEVQHTPHRTDHLVNELEDDCEAEFIDGSYTYCGCSDCNRRKAEDFESGRLPW